MQVLSRQSGRIHVSAMFCGRVPLLLLMYAPPLATIDGVLDVTTHCFEHSCSPQSQGWFWLAV